MSLTKEQIELLERSNRTIAIVGKFSNSTDKKEYIFSNVDKNADRPLSAPAFFELARPEICSQNNKTITIGNFSYQGYDLSTPLMDKKGAHSQPIMLDSQLLTTNQANKNFSTAEKIQAEGGILFQELLENLNTVSAYSHSNFPKSLLAISRDYLALYVDENCEDGIGMAKWQSNFSEDQGLNTAIVKYLSCYESDNRDNIAEIRAFLIENKYSGELLNTLIRAVVNLKNILVTENEHDTIWNRLKRERLFADGWLENISGDKNFGFAGPQVSKNTFMSWYNTFKYASDSVHRLIRSPVQHSFLFCYLASKYEAHSAAGTPQAARNIYDTSFITTIWPGHLF